MKINMFGKRNMPKLKLKRNILIFYSVKEDRHIVNKVILGNKSNTCDYVLVPIYIESGIILTDKLINNHIKSKVSGYKKGFDKVYIIKPCKAKSSDYIEYESMKSFATWIDKNNR
ncbi:MAG: hypothetical protein N4A64_06630 [Marinisporobacter sp.]|jgi:hypothetical protein|nr:hypothetical protein [Marinisporobacter sp.]